MVRILVNYLQKVESTSSNLQKLTPPDLTFPIEGESLIIVEGPEDARLIETLIKKSADSSSDKPLKDIGSPSIQIISMGGKDNIKNCLSLITVTSGFSSIKKLSIVMDADDRPDKRFQEIQTVLQNIKLLPIPQEAFQFTKNASDNLSIGVFLMPGKGRQGTLEHLLLQTIENNAGMDCVKDFYTCITGSTEHPLPDNPHNYSNKQAKILAEAYLITQKSPKDKIADSFQNNTWDLNSRLLKELKDFLVLTCTR